MQHLSQDVTEGSAGETFVHAGRRMKRHIIIITNTTSQRRRLQFYFGIPLCSVGKPDNILLPGAARLFFHVFG